MTWTTNAQRDILLAQMPLYHEHQSKGTIPEFWPTLFATFFSAFPELDETSPTYKTDAIPKKKGGRPRKKKNTEKEKENGDGKENQYVNMRERLRQWYDNQRDTTSKSAAAPVGRKVLNITRKGTRRPLVTQVFQRLYYPKYKEQVEAEYVKYNLALPPGVKAQPLLAFRNAQMAAIFEGESDEIKKEVFKAQSLIPDDDDNTEGGEGLTPNTFSHTQLKEFDENINMLARTLLVLMREIRRQTGRIGTITLGGPKSGAGRKVGSLSIHHEPEYGETFGSWYKDFQTAMASPFIEFLERTFPSLACQAFSLLHSFDGAQTRSQAASASQTASARSNIPTDQLSAPDGSPSPSSSAQAAASRRPDENTPPAILFPTSPSTVSIPSRFSPNSSRSALSSLLNAPAAPFVNQPVAIQPSRIITQASQQLPSTSAPASDQGEFLEQPASYSFITSRSMTLYEQEQEANVERNRPLLSALDARFGDDLVQGIPVPGPFSLKTREKQTRTRQSKGATKAACSSKRIENTSPDAGSKDLDNVEAAIDVNSEGDEPTPIIENDTVVEQETTTTAVAQVISQPADELPALSHSIIERTGTLLFDTESLVVEQVAAEQSHVDWDQVLQMNAAVEGMARLPEWAKITEGYATLDNLLQCCKAAKWNFRDVSRPVEMAECLKHKHLLENPPVVKNVDTSASSFHTWWTSLQPEWRGQAWPVARAVKQDEDWDGMACSGANWFMMVVLLLSWWSLQARDGSEMREVDSAVDDIEWALDQIMLSLCARGTKRGSDDERGSDDVLGGQLKKPKLAT